MERGISEGQGEESVEGTVRRGNCGAARSEEGFSGIEGLELAEGIVPAVVGAVNENRGAGLSASPPIFLFWFLPSFLFEEVPHHFVGGSVIIECDHRVSDNPVEVVCSPIPERKRRIPKSDLELLMEFVGANHCFIE